MDILRERIWQDFLIKSARDSRLGSGHIALFACLYQQWLSGGQDNMLLLYPSSLMSQAKIGSHKTYYKLVRQLHEYGYIRYVPSYYKKRTSKISLMELNEREKGLL